MGVNDFGGSASALNSPPLGGPGGWADSVAQALNNSDETVDARLAAYQPESEKGQSNGYAPLDGTGKVPAANLPTSDGGTGLPAHIVVADPDTYPGIDPTGATDSTAGMQSWADAIPDGGTGMVPPGTYRIDDTVDLADRSQTITAHGAYFEANSINPAFSIVGVFGAQQAIASITPEMSTGYSQSSETKWVTRLLLSAAPPAGWEVGDLIKVGADDVLPWSASDARAGQSFTIIGISGSTVTVSGVPRYDMTTGLRCAKYSASAFRWEGGQLGASAAVLGGGVQMPLGVFEVKRLLGPALVDLRFTSAAGPALSMAGCYSARILNMTVDYARDAGGMYGYGINDQKSEYTVVRNMHARWVRHAYTTNSANNSNGSNVGETGPVYGASVSGVCVGASQTSWDCHGDADSVTFLDCHSVDGYGAFMLRGIRNRVINALVEGPHPGNVVSAEIISSAAQVYGSHIDGLVARGVILDAVNGANAAMFNIKSDVMQDIPTVIDNVRASDCTLLYFINSDRQTVHVGRVVTDSGTNRTANGGVIVPLPTMVIT